MCKFYEYNISTQVYDGTKHVVVERFVNGFSIHNTGTTDLYFNGDRIQPGESKTVGGNAGEVYAGKIDLYYRVPSPAPAIIINMATVTQKYYIDRR
jgi:hypothetical protein